MATKSHLEQTFDKMWELLSKDAEPVHELRFHPKRRWRFDRAFPDEKVAVEIEGGVYMNGRHNRGKGMIDDMDKYNEALLNGWIVLRYSSNHLDNDPAKMVEQIKQALEFRRSGKDGAKR